MRDVSLLNSRATKSLAVCIALIICSLVINAQYGLLQLSRGVQALPKAIEKKDEVGQNAFSAANETGSSVLVTRLMSLSICTQGTQSENPQNCLSLFQRINKIYLGSLVNTVLIAALIALTMPLLAFTIASSENVLRSRGKRQAARYLELALDIVPYIMWTIILAGLARGVYGQENLLGLGQIFGQQTSKNFSYILTLLIQYLGFAAFLIAFQSRSCARWLLELQENRIIDGMRASGLPDFSIYFRLFYFGYRPLYYLRQVLFTFIFVLLFDYSLSVAKPIHQSGGPRMLFNVAAQFENKRQISERDLEGSGDQEFLSRINEINQINSREFSNINHRALGQVHFVNTKLVKYFEYQNFGLILLVFSFLFIRFDFREFLDER